MESMFVRHFILLATVVMCGCFGNRQTDYYLLTQSTATVPEIPPGSQILELGPVTIPTYLDRLGIAVRNSENRFAVSDLKQWAEPLNETITRLLRQRLMQCPRYAGVEMFPYRDSEKTTERVRIDITQFEKLPGEEVKLEAMISVGRGDAAKVPASITVKVEGQPGDVEHEQIVTAMSEALRKLADGVCVGK